MQGDGASITRRAMWLFAEFFFYLVCVGRLRMLVLPCTAMYCHVSPVCVCPRPPTHLTPTLGGPPWLSTAIPPFYSCVLT